MADELDARMRSLSAHTGAAFEAGSVGRPRGEEPPLGHPLPAPLGIDGDERRDPAGRERNRAGGGGGEAGGGAEGVAQASGSAARALPAQPEQERQQARVVVSGAPADDVSRDRHKKAWKMVLTDQQGQPPCAAGGSETSKNQSSQFLLAGYFPCPLSRWILGERACSLRYPSPLVIPRRAPAALS